MLLYQVPDRPMQHHRRSLFVLQARLNDVALRNREPQFLCGDHRQRERSVVLSAVLLDDSGDGEPFVVNMGVRRLFRYISKWYVHRAILVLIHRAAVT